MTDWLASDVAIALYLMGVFIIPAMLYIMCRDLRDEAPRPRSVAFLSALILGLCVLVMPLTALGLSLAVRYLGPVVGTLVFIPAIWAVGLRRGGYFHRIYRAFSSEEETRAPSTVPGAAPAL